MSVYNWLEFNTLQAILPNVLMHSPSPKFATYDLASVWFSNLKYLGLRQAQQITIYLVWDRWVGRPTRNDNKKKPMVTINAVNLVALTSNVNILELFHDFNGVFQVFCFWRCWTSKCHRVHLAHVTNRDSSARKKNGIVIIYENSTALLRTKRVYTIFTKTITSWWFQPIWKILVKLDHLPQVGVKIKNIWNHHLVFTKTTMIPSYFSWCFSKLSHWLGYINDMCMGSTSSLGDGYHPTGNPYILMN